jgi:hypothetical protein
MRRVRKVSGLSMDIGREFYEVPDDRWEKTITDYRRLVAQSADYRGPCPMPHNHFMFTDPEAYGYERIDLPEPDHGEQGRLL